MEKIRRFVFRKFVKTCRELDNYLLFCNYLPFLMNKTSLMHTSHCTVPGVFDQTFSHNFDIIVLDKIEIHCS